MNKKKGHLKKEKCIIHNGKIELKKSVREMKRKKDMDGGVKEGE